MADESRRSRLLPDAKCVVGAHSAPTTNWMKLRASCFVEPHGRLVAAHKNDARWDKFLTDAVSDTRWDSLGRSSVRPQRPGTSRVPNI